MANLSDNIKYFRKQNKLTQKELARKLKIAPTAISAWEVGRNKPLMDNIEQMASIFGIPKSKLLGDEIYKIQETESPELIPSTLQKINATSSQLEHSRQIIVLDTAETLLEQQKEIKNNEDTVVELFSYNYYDHAASAGTGQYLNDVQVETIELPVDYDADFVIPVYGNSMEPKYHSGDYVFVKLSINLSDGDIGVFEYYGDAYVKQLFINTEGAFLHSLNQCGDYPDIPIDADSDFRIIGEVVGSYSGNHS
ncbi:helix-turn-helix domain-containing protein [Streptococcus dysgalactiae]|uniref:XRE family transcriptional regulator n=1 Tax=Streptococcus dysgalactiae TaxID=1334 RepID=UPI000DFC6923|nr:S24 family peptidase [Streptococcus dysgalactiae]QQT02901.1 helix-turn-helix domain-containing protein [Streptococcus dysgalactiae]SUN44605.1 Phage transcriptional repressor [Streptococcus dysgalactiae subsp. dysgalactiae]SUN49068.1 Phage transcriptional repressor [Streptococcus dysgalactiae]